MSFILDALKKSETDRQERAAAEFASIPSSVDEPGTPKWIWAIALLLLVNAAVLAAFLLRGDDGVPAIANTVLSPPPAATTGPEPTAEPDFRERIQLARAEREATAEPEPQTAPPPTVTSPAVRSVSRPAETTTGRRQPVLENSSLALPTLTEIRLNDGVELPDLHLDIHVYGASAAERFVFINMQKLNEGDVLEAGPSLESITPDGVILDYRGTRFVLPRE